MDSGRSEADGKGHGTADGSTVHPPKDTILNSSCVALVYSPTPVNSLKRKASSSIASEEDKENLDDSGLFTFSPHSPVTSSSSNGSGNNPLKRKAHSILDEKAMPIHKPGQDLLIQTSVFWSSSNSSTRRFPNNQLDSPRKPPALSSSNSAGGSGAKAPAAPSTTATLNHTFLLNNFQHVPSLDFGMLSLGSSHTMELHLSNPSEFGVATVVLEDIVPKAAAAAFFVDTHQALVLPMQSATTITVTFTPSTHGRVAGKLYIRLNKRFRLFCALHGATRPPSTASALSSSSHRSLASSSSSSSSAAPTSSAPPSSLVKRPKLAKQPSIPETSSDQEWKKRRMVYDAHWIPKQEAGFQKWLNFTLLGAHFSEIKDETPLSQDRYAQLRQLAVTRLESKIRAAAVATYHHPQTDHVLFRLQTEINARRLTIRSDRPLHVDVGLQQSLMDLFNSYHPLWLTLALEVVLGIRLVDSLSDLLRPASTNASKLPHFLKRTIVERIVQDPAFKLKHVMALPASATSTDLLAQLKATTLVRCLMIVYFLDQAHVQRHVDHVALPCLFRPSSRIKRSKQVLIELCQQFLAQEGNVLRHLDHLEYRVAYQQTVLEEMDMQVVNLAVDLRDGVRLARLIETLDPSCKGLLSPHLRLPAVSRLQKVHNVQVTLTCLQAKYQMPIASGVESSGVTRHSTGLSAKDIVDGHREKTLALLWQLISYFKLSHVVHVEQVEMEILRIQQRRRRGGVWLNDVITGDRPSAADGAINHFAIDKSKEPIAWHLLEWCRVVCANYNVPIRNFTASFADGKALCLMVHYYHPRLLEKWEIQWTTSDTTTERMATMTPLLANERANFALVNHKVKQLGQVPVLLPLFDSEHLPEEKCILTFLAYLHSRLLGASREIHAAFCLQHWWVPRFRRTRAAKRDRSARVLQRFWASTSLARYIHRSVRRRLGYVCTLQSFGRVVLAKQAKAARLHAVRVLQSAARRWLRTSLSNNLTNERLVQQSARPASHTIIQRQEAIAATTLQAWWHRYHRRHQTQTLWRALVFHGLRVRHTAATILQRWYHRHHVQGFWYALVYYVRLETRQVSAATAIQRWHRHLHDQTRPLWRAWGAALHNPRVLATRRLQTWWRHCRAVHHVQQNWNNAIYQLVQRKAAVHAVSVWWRHVRMTALWRSVVHAAVDAQRHDLWNQVREASAMRLQRWFRNYCRVYGVRSWWTQLATLVWERHADAATTIQRAWLGHAAKKSAVAAREHAAATVLQTWTRRSLRLWRCRDTWIQLAYDLWELDTATTAATMIQTAWRRRQRVQKWKDAVSAVVNLARTRAAAATRLQQWWVTSKHVVSLKQWWTELTMALWERRDLDAAAMIVQRWWRQRRQVHLAQVEAQRKIADQIRQKQREEDTQRQLEAAAATRIQLWWVQAQHVWDVKHRWQTLAIELWQQHNHELAASMIQDWWRQVRAMQVLHLTEQIQVHASVRVQRWWRRRCQVHRLADFWHHVVSLVRHEQRRTAASTLQTWVQTLLANSRIARTQHRWTSLIHQVRAANAAAEAVLERLQLHQQREKDRRLRADEARHQEFLSRRNVAATTVQQFVRRYQQLQWWRSVVIHVQNQHAAASYIQQWWHAMKVNASQQQQHQPQPIDEASTVVAIVAPRRPISTRTVWTIPPVVVLQKWWRGMSVRLGCAAAMTIMRHRVQAAQTSAVVATLALRQQSAGYVQEESIPLRYRLKRALAILNTSPRLHEMLQAVHTLEMCTRLSKECCVECVAHRVPRLLYKAIRKCNRSRPHLELLHQLLQVCLHLTAPPDAKTTTTAVATADDVDGVGMSLELWIDLLQMHRDSTVLFTLSARLCKRTLQTLNANEWSLGEAPRRLRLLHALMSKKAKTKSTVDRVAPNTAKQHAKEHLHPQKAAAMLQALVDLCE